MIWEFSPRRNFDFEHPEITCGTFFRPEILEIVEIKFMKPHMEFEESGYLKASCIMLNAIICYCIHNSKVLRGGQMPLPAPSLNAHLLYKILTCGGPNLQVHDCKSCRFPFVCMALVLQGW